MFRGVVAGRVLIQTRRQTTLRVRRRHQRKVSIPCVFLPFAWGTCLGLVAGVLIVMLGTGICVFGYNYKMMDSDVLESNITTTIITPVSVDLGYSTSNDVHMRRLTLVGPIIIGFGCFVFVVSCVVVCEKRDKVIGQLKDQTRDRRLQRPDLYDNIIRKLKAQYEEKQGKENLAFDNEEEGNGSGKFDTIFGSLRRTNSTKSNASSIENALKQMTSQMFSIDVENNKEHTLEPVKVMRRLSFEHPKFVHPYSQSMEVYGNDKFHSTSCLHDLLGLKRDSLAVLISDETNTHLPPVAREKSYWVENGSIKSKDTKQFSQSNVLTVRVKSNGTESDDLETDEISTNKISKNETSKNDISTDEISKNEKPVLARQESNWSPKVNYSSRMPNITIRAHTELTLLDDEDNVSLTEASSTCLSDKHRSKSSTKSADTAHGRMDSGVSSSSEKCTASTATTSVSLYSSSSVPSMSDGIDEHTAIIDRKSSTKVEKVKPPLEKCDSKSTLISNASSQYSSASPSQNMTSDASFLNLADETHYQQSNV